MELEGGDYNIIEKPKREKPTKKALALSIIFLILFFSGLAAVIVWQIAIKSESGIILLGILQDIGFVLLLFVAVIICIAIREAILNIHAYFKK